MVERNNTITVNVFKFEISTEKDGYFIIDLSSNLEFRKDIKLMDLFEFPSIFQSKNIKQNIKCKKNKLNSFAQLTEDMAIRSFSKRLDKWIYRLSKENELCVMSAKYLLSLTK